MFSCIITGSLCSIVSVLSCVAACYVVADCQLWYEIKELLLLLLLFSDRPRECSGSTPSFISAAKSHFIAANKDSCSSADRARESPPRGALYKLQRFISLETAKLLALLIVLGCACNHAFLRYKHGKCGTVCDCLFQTPRAVLSR